MKKIHEILRIGMKYHYCWGGKDTFMCVALSSAKFDEMITDEDEDYAHRWIDENVLHSRKFSTLVAALGIETVDWRLESVPVVKAYWEALVNKLEKEDV